jgi:2-dehydro-3-deoxyphosphooctonate aldolase (KDO 8-P synthase)
MSLSANPEVVIGAGAAAVRFGNRLPLSIIAGPCALESRDHALRMAGALRDVADRLGVGIVYKSSFDKANRTSAAGKRGLGLEASLDVFAEVKERFGFAILTDVHENDQCARAAQVVDVLQIPAFLCRQTDLLLAAAATGKPVNVKKGQFLAPWDMKNVVAKVTGAGNPDVLVTERGASFGYNTLVSDMRGLPIMAEQTGAPVIFDATHSVQQPGGQGTSSGPCSRARLWPWASPACSSKPMTIRPTPSRMARTRCRSANSKACCVSSWRSTPSPKNCDVAKTSRACRILR